MLEPEPRLAVGRALAQSWAVTAIMDNSDGLPLSFSDLAQVSPGGLCGAGGDAARGRWPGGDSRAEEGAIDGDERGRRTSSSCSPCGRSLGWRRPGWRADGDWRGGG